MDGLNWEKYQLGDEEGKDRETVTRMEKQIKYTKGQLFQFETKVHDLVGIGIPHFNGTL